MISQSDPPTTPDGKRRAIRNALIIGIPVFLLLLGLLIFHTRRFFPFLEDDALISLRYAQRLLQGHGLTWTDGRPVEGYTNFLWVMLSAFLGFLGFDLVTAVRLLGYACVTGTLLCFFVAFPPSEWHKALPVLIGGGYLVLSGPVGIWTAGGLEGPLILFLLSWAILFGFRILEDESPRRFHIFSLGLCLGLLLLTRPDSIIFLAVFIGVILLVRGRDRKTIRLLAAILVIPLILLSGHLIFRLAYYGDWVPNTAYAKLVFSREHLWRGLKYGVEGLASFAPFLDFSILIGVLCLFHRYQVRKIILLGSVIASWTAFVIFVGGDIFPGWRYFLPMTAPIAFTVMIGVDWLVRDRIAKVQQRLLLSIQLTVCAAIAVPIFGMYFRNQTTNSLNKVNYWIWDGKKVGEMLKSSFGKYHPLLAVDTGGSLPFWSELPAIDMLGLNDYHIARNPPAGIGAGSIGHELGDGKYVLAREPDLIMFCSPWGWREACYQSGVQMQQMPEFYEAYTYTKFFFPDVVPVGIWIRKWSPVIGILRSGNRIEIPPYLMNGNPAMLVYRDDGNEFYVRASAGEPVIVESIPLPAGTWELDLVSQDEVRIEIEISAKKTASLQWNKAPVQMIIDSDAIVTLTLLPQQTQSADIYRIVFRRISPP